MAARKVFSMEVNSGLRRINAAHDRVRVIQHIRDFADHLEAVGFNGQDDGIFSNSGGFSGLSSNWKVGDGS